MLPKREPFISNIPKQEEKEEMPKRKTEAPQEDLTASLFGDISQALPEATETIEDIRNDCGNCTRCPLYQGRTKIVHTTGNFNADLMFIGEAPGANEDAQGEPFVGRAGQLLDKIIEAIGQKRPDVAIGNVNRCRPPGNRQPLQVEADVCKQFLIREIAVIRPKVIVVLGNTAMQNLLNIKTGITKMRGNFQDYYGVKVMPTFHPAYLLRDPSKKRETWEDMKRVRDYLGTLK
jgi:DNA polymerase